MNWRCFFGRHQWDTDREPINGYLWRFCKHCARREATTPGETAWRLM